ncbi:HERV-H LTR-associating protein 1 [Sceloporus undulatus]|uniref:HERV-H LTR-associating protein 1 n=1 Tax=Sceloporus undulatus TaxID=8520 RepID=UPI001C4D81E6|nr:HERV-H LTR-associating protein 1 [Sceloporus undulatus]
MALLFFLFVSNLAATTTKGENRKEDRIAVLATAELPAKSLDLAAINLTELVNGMLNTALKGTNKFFSLLSITSYSSYAFHKVSIVIYNISNLKNVDPTKFPMRYCYCLNNRTNDLTDFTALLVDIVGNTTNYLTEIFKSTSILSVSQSNNTDCVYICVMSGRTGRNLSDLWEAIEKSPVINYTFSGNVSDLLDLNLIFPGWKPLREDADKVLSDTAKGTWTFKSEQLPSWLQTTALKQYEIPSVKESSSSPAPANPPPAPAESYESPPGDPTTLMAGNVPLFALPISTQRPGVLLKVHSRCPQAIKKGSSMTTPSIPVQKINPCVMELCKFYQQCLCSRDRSYSREDAMRFCIENYSWFLKNAMYVCEKVKRTAYSKTLKQKCLASICKSI